MSEGRKVGRPRMPEKRVGICLSVSASTAKKARRLRTIGLHINELFEDLIEAKYSEVLDS